MAKRVLKNAAHYLDGYSMGGNENQMTLDVSKDIVDATCFGSSWAESLSGVKSGAFSAEGFFDPTVTDAPMFGTIDSTGSLMSVMPTGETVGEPAFIFKDITANYAPGAAHGEVMGFSFNANSDGVVASGNILDTRTVAGSSNGAAYQAGAIAAAQTGYFALHVSTVTGSTETLIVVIESDDASNFASPSTHATFTTVTGRTAELKTVSGAVTDDYWRATYTTTGSTETFKALVTMAIQA